MERRKLVLVGDGIQPGERFAVMLDSGAIESGLVTPPLKPKRREREVRFAGEIAALYRERAPSK